MQKRTKLFGLLLCGAMLFSLMTPLAFVGDRVFAESSGLCEHHPEHDEACGYTAPVQGSPCTHVHDASCGYSEEIGEIPCDKNCAQAAPEGVVVHAADCAYTPGVEATPCSHVHDEECGYVEASEGSRCTYVCELCSAAVKSRAVSRSVAAQTLQNHIVTQKVVDPAGTTVNLFDYWVNDSGDHNGKEPKEPHGDILTKDHRHIREKPSQWGKASWYSSDADWWRGINQGHLLLFGDGMIHGGLWNKGAGESTDYGKAYAGMERIVNRTLTLGYPTINLGGAKQLLTGITDPKDDNYRDYTKIGDYKLAGDHINKKDGNDYTYDGKDIQNLSNTLIGKWEQATGQSLATGTESLAYLFDPAVQNNYKKSYQNIKGLFQLDEEGYYYYNMRQNFAEYQQNTAAVRSNGASALEEEHSDGRFVLYDAPAVLRSDASGNVGNFFPFNTGAQVFDGVNAQGKLTSAVSCSNNFVNHHFGMTVNLNFRQPVNGQINMGSAGNKHMTFEFSGDDDVWVYIDDVLVLDLGGIHSEVYGIIDFATGDVFIGQGFAAKGTPDYDLQPDGSYNTPEYCITHTTLKALAEAAGVDTNTSAWNGNTFASNTDHELNMFYLERGNYDSSLAMRFNLQSRLYQQIKKVDQNGNPISDVEFELYKAEKTGDGDSASYKAVGQSLGTLKTGSDGMALFEEIEDYDEDGDPIKRPFNFADRYTNENMEYYILKETVTPAGYRTLPEDVVLQYHNNTTMLTVVNRWTTGAYASFISNVTGNSNVTYGSFSTVTGGIEPSETITGEASQRDGLVIAVPMLQQEDMTAQGEDGKWVALYGSNTSGFRTVIPENRTALAWRTAVLQAALYQCANTDTPGWYLEWDAETQRLEGVLSDLPGRADRYHINGNTSGDMKMVYGVIEPAVFTKLGITADTSQARYEALTQYVQREVARYCEQHGNEGKSQAELMAEAIEAISQTIYTTAADGGEYDAGGSYQDRGFSFLNTDQFIRNFRSLLYIPNEQRELRVWKVDQDGKGVNGVTFTLYRAVDVYDQDGNLAYAAGTVAATGVTATVDGRDGVLVFKPPDRDKDGGYSTAAKAGYAWIGWAQELCNQYYLKETAAPDGYILNNTQIPVRVASYSIYADAGSADDGVTVMAGVGKLVQTMVKYAADETVNITLRDITAYAQTKDSGSFDTEDWEDVFLDATQEKRYMNLHYGANAVVSYGLHDKDGGQTLYPFFVTDTGYLRARAKQNYSALSTQQPAYDEDGVNVAKKEDITGQDIQGLFSLLNIVVVTDQTEQETNTGTLTLSKRLAGKPLQEDYSRNFNFTLRLYNQDGTEVDGDFYFYGTNKSGYIRSGGTIPLHHDESVTLLGLPAGIRYQVTEDDVYTDEQGNSLFTAVGGLVKEGVIIASAETEAGGEEQAAANYINVRAARVPFTFFKVDAQELDTYLSGARFAIYYWNGKVPPAQGSGETDSEKEDWEGLIPLSGPDSSSQWKLAGVAESDSDGLVDFGVLAIGTYRLVEVCAPGGYILPSGQWQFELSCQTDKNGSPVMDGDGNFIAQIKAASTVGKTKPPAFAVSTVTEDVTGPDGSVTRVQRTVYKLPNLTSLTLPLSGIADDQRPLDFMLLGAALFAVAAAGAFTFSVHRRRRANVAGRHFRN